MQLIENNKVSLSGTIVSGFKFNHKTFGEGFYMVELSVERLSGSVDIIPLMISERLLDVNKDYYGCRMEVSGQFRSYNRYQESKNHLELFVFVKEISFTNELINHAKYNQIFLEGCVCKLPVYRQTRLGREVADIFLSVARPYRKSDYIPCIIWGRNARYASSFEVGTRIQVWGRIQSREYIRKLSDTEGEKRVAYEVSISKMEVIPDENKN